MFYELRQYRLRPGTRDRWIALMQERLETVKPRIDEMLLRELMQVTRLEPTGNYLGTATLES